MFHALVASMRRQGGERVFSPSLIPRTIRHSTGNNPLRIATRSLYTHYASHEDTICALASAKGRAGVSVIRVSGPDAQAVVGNMLKPDVGFPTPRQATIVNLTDPVSGHALDNALVLSFPAPRSYTGEDVVELHVHGSPSVVTGTLHAVTRDGARMATPGEFTRRAYENGKLSLPQVEGLADLLNAETESQRSRALQHLSGQTTAVYHQWRQELISAGAHLSALLDFAEDDKIEERVYPDVQEQLQGVISSMKDHLARAVTSIAVEDGLQVGILGPPNTGKSSLLNRLAQRDIAIVSDHAGTTRDIIETRLNLAGNPWTVFDTAGLRGSDDVVEKEGMKRAVQRLQQACVKVVVLSLKNETDWQGMKDEVMHCINDPTSIVILNKADILYDQWQNQYLHEFESMRVSPALLSDLLAGWGNDVITALQRKVQAQGDVLLVSIHNPSNVSFVLDRIQHATQAYIDALTSAEGAGGCHIPSVITKTRHQQLVNACVDSLTSACSLAPDEDTGLIHGLELAAEDVRHAIACIGEITGQGVSADEIWDVMFHDFCIGK